MSLADIPLWVWVGVLAAVILALQIIVWCMCIVSGRASKAEEWDAITGTNRTDGGNMGHRYAAIEDRTPSTGDDPDTTVGA